MNKVTAYQESVDLAKKLGYLVRIKYGPKGTSLVLKRKDTELPEYKFDSSVYLRTFLQGVQEGKNAKN